MCMYLAIKSNLQKVQINWTLTLSWLTLFDSSMTHFYFTTLQIVKILKRSFLLNESGRTEGSLVVILSLASHISPKY